MLNDNMKKAMRIIDATLGYYQKHENRDYIFTNLERISMYVSDLVRSDTFPAKKNDFKALLFLMQENGYEFETCWTTPTCCDGWLPEHRTFYFHKKSTEWTVSFDIYPKDK